MDFPYTYVIYIYSALLCAFCFGSFYGEGDHQGAQSGGKCFPMYLSHTQAREGRGFLPPLLFPSVFIWEKVAAGGAAVFLIFFFLLPSLALSRLCCLPWGGGQRKKERKGPFLPPPLSSTYPSSPRGRKRKRKKPASHGIRTMRGENGGITRGKKEEHLSYLNKARGKGFPLPSRGGRKGGRSKGRRKEGRKQQSCVQQKHISLSASASSQSNIQYLSCGSILLHSLSFFPPFFPFFFFLSLSPFLSFRSLVFPSLPQKSLFEKPSKASSSSSTPTPVATFK